MLASWSRVCSSNDHDLASPVQIVSAVQYCHQKRIVHRDLKVSRAALTQLLLLTTRVRDILGCVTKFKKNPKA